MRKASLLVLSLIAAGQTATLGAEPPAKHVAVATPSANAAPAAAPGPSPETGALPADAAAAPPQPNPYLQQAGAALQAAPSASSFAAFMQTLRNLLAQPSMAKQPSAAIIKANPILAQLGAKVVDASPGRIWTFPRISFTREVIVQWNDTKATTTFVGRRHKVKHVSYTVTPRIQSLVLPTTVVLKEARVLGGEEGARYLILVGDQEGSQLWLHAFRAQEGGWVDAPDHFASLPAFLTGNVSGRVSFRGNDMIFNVGRVVPPSGSQTTQLPEAESSTYRFLLKLTDSGYQLQRHVPDLTQFGTVRQFLDAVANNRTDVQKSLVADSKLLSIPRYLGMRGPFGAFKVVQMASPPSGAPRYRLVSGGRNDLIFEVAKMKNQPIIRAIFIAPPDQFLHEISGLLPTYDQLVPPPTPPAETNAAADSKHT